MILNMLDPLSINLKGSHLIEASAGTGKTWTIAALVLRLIMEEEQTRMPEILIVTFTDAAAAEILERVQKFLLLAKNRLQALIEDNQADEESAEIAPFVDQAIIKEGQKHEAEELKTVQYLIYLRLQRAYLELNQALITTIHGLCQSLLKSYALETGSSFDREVLTEIADLNREILYDFNRIEFSSLSEEDLDGFINSFLENKPKKLKAEKIQSMFQPSHFQKAIPTLLNAPLLSSPKPAPDIDHGSQQNNENPWEAAWNYLQRELPRRTASTGNISFRDMIIELDQALQSRGEALAKKIRSRYRALLVDEFQDTDPQQYRIFNSLFGQPSSQDSKLFIMIGDPKQAIYKFRGGDLDTYFKARSQVPAENIWTMAINYRSSARVLKVVNHIFAQEERPVFKHGETSFTPPPLEPAPSRRAHTDTENSEQASSWPALTLWVNYEKTTPSLYDIGHAMADKIFNLQGSGQAFSHIAILVSSHNNGQVYQKCLADRGIPSSLGKGENLWQSEQVQDLLLVLQAALHPQKEAYRRSLLTSPLVGWDAKRLQETEDSGIDSLLENFLLQAKAKGIATAFLHLLKSEPFQYLQAQENSPEGDLFFQRRITNVRHILELLTGQEAAWGREPKRLLDWLIQQKNSGSIIEQRLESDAQAVQIVTMHKSKGLQWPIVMLPDLIKGLDSRNLDTYETRLADGSCSLNFDIEHIDERKEANKKELSEEKIRLGYVALTRAEYQIFAVVNAEKNSHITSPPDQVLLAPLLQDSDLPEELLAIEDLNTAVSQARAAMRSAGRGEGVQKAGAKRPEVLDWATQGRTIQPRWSLSSYSGLTRNIHSVRAPALAQSNVPATGFFAFPRGAAPGTALHTVFERIDFKESLEQAGIALADCPTAYQNRLRGILEMAGLGKGEYLELIHQLIGRVITSPLPPIADIPCLGEISGQQRIAEMEFYLHPRQDILGGNSSRPTVPAQEIALAVQTSGVRAEVAAESRIDGYLNGLIDLVFTWNNSWYILDWKSNHLGNSYSDYNTAALERAMDEHNYHLQYHLYTLAVHRHLKTRLKDYSYAQDFGGVFYLFLRGIDGKGNGIYYKRPEKSVIDKLESYL